MLILLFLFLLLFLVPAILFLVTLQNTLKLISAENRRMPPEQVWLVLIPFFGFVWQFIIVNRLADSLKYEFIKKDIATEEDRPGAAIGIAYCVLSCCCVIPVVSFFTGIASLICWVIYWSKISGYKNRLEYNQPSSFNTEIN